MRDSDAGRQKRERKLIELYTAATPNGWKATITWQELGLDYELHPVDFVAGEQRQEYFLRLNPNGRIPVIVDHDGAVGPEGATIVATWIVDKDVPMSSPVP